MIMRDLTPAAWQRFSSLQDHLQDVICSIAEDQDDGGADLDVWLSRGIFLGRQDQLG